MFILRILLLPISVIYGAITFIRNLLFDWRIFSVTKHQVPVISVGNLSMGGTGKTPHVEFLISRLKDNYKLATLSRGYGRKTKAYVLADANSDANTIGDEPLQYYHKFENIKVAVDENRNRGAKKLLKTHPETELLILDDAYQHRYIHRDLNIMLSDFHNVYKKDHVVPSGQLREFRRGANRADIIIITKTPVVLSPITRRRFEDELKLKDYQKLLFSKIEYDGFVSFNQGTKLRKDPTASTILLFAGIANSYPLQDYLKRFCNELIVLSFADHHNYTQKDIELIHQTYNDVFSKNKLIVTTEKDAQRLSTSEHKDILKTCPLFYVPIHIAFHNGDEKELMDSIQNIF